MLVFPLHGAKKAQGVHVASAARHAPVSLLACRAHRNLRAERHAVCRNPADTGQRMTELLEVCCCRTANSLSANGGWCALAQSVTIQ